MDLFAGKMLVRKNGEQVLADVVLKDKIIGLYFSAHWCPPCRGFTPMLSGFYNDLINQGAAFEIIFVTCDETPEDMKSYMKESHGDWVALPHGDPLIKVLEEKHSISGIPTLIVIKSNGDVITTEGRKEVQQKGAICFSDWRNK